MYRASYDHTPHSCSEKHVVLKQEQHAPPMPGEQPISSPYIYRVCQVYNRNTQRESDPRGPPSSCLLRLIALVTTSDRDRRRVNRDHRRRVSHVRRHCDHRRSCCRRYRCRRRNRRVSRCVLCGARDASGSSHCNRPGGLRVG